MRNLIFCALLTTLSAQAAISNMIVFGDSLSDGGNFPESRVPLWHLNAPKTLANSVGQFYVPFSNPVDTKTSNPESFPWPTLDDHYLSPQAPIENHSEKRQFHSMSWPQFFLSLAKFKKQTSSDLISPSTLLNSHALPPTISYNYAWGFAASGEGCINPHYKKITSCDAKNIATAKETYVNQPTAKNYQNILVPGLIRQTQLFVDDLHNQKINVDKQTIYAFWIGGNDLIMANNALHHKNPFPTISFAFGNTGTHILKSIETVLQALPKTKRPAAVYVFELFNPELTPAYHTQKIAKLGNFLVKCSNFWLRWDAAVFNLISDTKVVVVPIYQWFETDSVSHYFRWRAGEDCYVVVGHFGNPDHVPASNCDGFMFWNALHPSSTMNAILAERFYDVWKTHQSPSTNPVSIGEYSSYRYF